jgi:NADH:ubiquinone oxidoreductase subunit 5 (subunit L)/multisubunit Na+/H+ antiporter MnhA subunit
MIINYIDKVIKAGAVCSLIGTFILILLVLVIVIFPVQKNCGNDTDDCEYISSAPSMLKTVVSPQTLVMSLLTIAAGILIFRFGTWYKLKRPNL